MYVVIELQKMDESTVANLIYQYETLNLAESAFHSILAAAAISSVPVHSAVVLTDSGRLVMSKSYTHNTTTTATDETVAENEILEPTEAEIQIPVID